MSYHLRCDIVAHANDVRALNVLDNCIISGSRDMTVKLWSATGDKYEQSAVLRRHSGFISAVAVLPPSQDYPLGLIITGSHDKLIIAWQPYMDEPYKIFDGHSGAVCSLYPSITPGFFLSSSWDSTAKYWNVLESVSCFTLFGHIETVWAVIQVENGDIVTASADKAINVYLADGTFSHNLKGHTDCVRSLASLGGKNFLSCSNDGTIRKWSVSEYTCLAYFKVHSDYIYSLAVNRELEITAFAGEGGFLTIWVGKGAVQRRQTIHVPVTSIWCVNILPNSSDIVVGASDGHIRIYSTEKAVFGPPTTTVITSQSTLDEEAKPVEVRETDGWSTLGIENTPVSKSQSSTFLNGKNYDFVFDYKINGQDKPLKLPFNKGDNLMGAAEQFIKDNNLQESLVSNVVAFLIENMAISEASSSKAIEELECTSKYFPVKDYVFFKKYDFEAICKKIDEFVDMLEFEQADSKTLFGFITSVNKSNLNEGVSKMLHCMMIWPEEIVYPILDIARIACFCVPAQDILFNNVNKPTLLTSLINLMESKNTVNKMLLFRILSNIFACTEGEKLIFENKKEILTKLPQPIMKHKGLEVAVCTFIVNMTVAASRRKDADTLLLCLNAIQRIIGGINDPEAMFRILVAVGTIGVLDGFKIKNQEIIDTVANVQKWEIQNDLNSKAVNCAIDISKYVLLRE